jgi:L-asparaginase II
VRVLRSGLEESVHFGDAAVVDADGSVVAWVGDPSRTVFARSSMKPLQAIVSLSLAPFPFEDREVAVMCASHNAEPVHLAAVRAILGRAGLGEESLRCPEMRPWDDETLEADPTKRRINSDCSGKHAGMLAACVAQGWPVESYPDPGHPLQEAVTEAVTSLSGERDPARGVDGCGVVVHGMPLAAMATIYARLGRPERWGSLGPHAVRATQAMRNQPYLVAGRNRADTAVMEAAPLIVKSGAEGLACASVPERGLGVAVKIRDGGGSRPTSGVALIRVLRLLDALDDGAMQAVQAFASPAVLGGGEPVGSLEADFDLLRP